MMQTLCLPMCNFVQEKIQNCTQLNWVMWEYIKHTYVHTSNTTSFLSSHALFYKVVFCCSFFICEFSIFKKKAHTHSTSLTCLSILVQKCPAGYTKGTIYYWGEARKSIVSNSYKGFHIWTIIANIMKIKVLYWSERLEQFQMLWGQ